MERSAFTQWENTQKSSNFYPCFPHILITATVSTGYIYIITLVCSSREKTHLLGKKHRPSAGTDTLSSPGSTSRTSLKYLDLWIQAYLSTAAQKQQQVLLCAGWHYFLLFAYWKKAPPPLHTTLCLQFPCTEVGAVRKFRMVGPESDETIIRKRFLSEDCYNFKA